MVIPLKPHMADRVPVAIWDFLEKSNAAIIADRDAGSPPTPEQLSELAWMIRRFRESKNTNTNTNAKG